MKAKFQKNFAKASEYYPLLAILIGVALVATTIAPFHNIDTDLEFQTAQATIKWGMPYYPSYGQFLNQPPIGFYTEAAFFKVFGSNFDLGTGLITAFGLGATLFVYHIGKMWYGKRAGLLAAALFGFTPWQMILSRSFLIDAQCLLLSLIFLFVGMMAIRKNSFKLIIVSGLFFAAAFLTKFYALYSLIPLGLFYLYSRPKELKVNLKWITAFFLPVLLGFFLWYQVISGQGILAAFKHADIAYYNTVVPSPFFAGYFLVDAVGILFIISSTLSMVLCFWARKHFGGIVIFDLMCLATIIAAVGVNTYLGAVLDLSSPYGNPIKYVYQALPYLSLLAASLIGKAVSLLNLAKSRPKLRILGFSLLAGAVFLVAVALYRNMDYCHMFSTWNYLLFRAAPNQIVGYSFFHPGAISDGSPLMILQFLGVAFALSGLMWAGRTELALLRRHFM